MEAFGNFDEQPREFAATDGFGQNGLNFDNNEGGDDIFAAAGDQMGMSNQGVGQFSNADGGIDNDLTPEERDMIQKVEQENEEKKKALYAK